MIKKINQYLVTHHPQIWNTKLVWVLSAILITHLLYFIAGYLHFDDFNKLHIYSDINSTVVYSTNIGFSVLTSFLILVVWLVFYLRNNPFKSIYPLKPSYFITEFSIIFIIAFSGILFYKSYAVGFVLAAKNKTADVNLVEELNTLNLAHALIPEDKRDYKLHSSCDSLDYIDSLQKLGFKSREYYNDDESILEETETIKTKVITSYDDSLVGVAIRDFERREKEDNNLSLLHYCHKESDILDSATLSKYEINNRVNQLLQSGNKKEVAAILERFEKMTKKYGIENTAATRMYTEYAFSSSKFRPSHFVNNVHLSKEDAAYSEAEDVGYNFPNGKIDFEDLEKSLVNIYGIRNDKGTEFKFWLLMLYLAFAGSLLLFTFRLTPIRVWFTAIAAHFGLNILVGLIGALTIRNEHGFYFMAYIIFIGAYIAHITLRNRYKKTAGVMLVWVSWWLPFLGILVLEHLKDAFRPKEYYNGKIHGISPTYDFLTDNADWLILFVLVLSFLYIGWGITRHFRTWMALPEE
ncbi:MAG: hypothetical protein JST49_00290 [Bacteroidetes bacterium]|nr:hypothetical protein [Bacteroidota bacterium]